MSAKPPRRSVAWLAGRLTARWGLPLALVVLAAVCYVVGYRKGTVFLIVLGIVLEVFFWRRILRDTAS
ncbi:MAG: hypothetical protein ACK4XK_06600 [Casimicrobiaceae bacterium]